MKKTLAAGALLFAVVALALATDDPTRIWSDPAVPSREALDRLNLEMAWAVYVPMDGKRDAFTSIQLDGTQVIAQTRSGLVTVLDAENGGRALWRSRPGRSYQAALPPAFNSRQVFTNDSGDVYALDRQTGAVQWQFNLRVALSAPLSADDKQVYLSNVEARLIALRLPEISAPTPAPSSPGEAAPAAPPPAAGSQYLAPTIAWDFDTNRRVENKAVLSTSAIFLAIPTGSYLGVPKLGDNALGNQELYHFAGDSRYSASRGYSDTAAYLPTLDAHLYAVDLDSGKVLWRYFPGRPVTRAPLAVNVAQGAVVDKDLYITTESKGMARLNRETGEPLWKIAHGDYSPEADRFLAANPKFVYATDEVGRMLVLDRKNGALLSRYDVHDYVYPVVNADTDRIYLAANNGLIVCLHDKDYPQSLAYRQAAAPVTEKSLKEREKQLTDLLAKPITDAGGEKMSFKDYRAKIKKQYGIEMFVSAKAFADLKKPAPDEQMIQTPKVDNKPLSDAVNDVVKQAGGEATQVLDKLIISPAKK
jgi:outer membrane protein assembly factor BamB